MDRVRRLRELWSWLPAFRAAGETEHLPTASEAIRVSPPAISRAIHLLEGAIGKPMFERRGRGMSLTRDGHILLRGLRDAMRIVDDAVDAITHEVPRGPAIISSTSELATAFAVPALQRLAAAAPDMIPELRIDPATEQPRLLERGLADVALSTEAFPREDVIVEALAELRRGVYRSAASGIAGQRSSRELDPGYVAYPRDGWPADRARRVRVHVPDVDVAADVCAGGTLLVVLPDELGRRRSGLRRSRGATIPSSPLYVTYRHPVAEHPRTKAILGALRTSG